MLRTPPRGTLLTLLLLTTVGIAEESRDSSPSNSHPSPQWFVRATPNFRIYYQSNQVELAREAALQAEAVRSRLFREWLNESKPPGWQVRCDVHIHRTIQSYLASAGRNAPTPGYSSVTVRRGRVVSRRIDLLATHTDLMHAVLPHEVSHVLMADEFGDRAPPLWVDEGIAVLAEKATVKCAHERTLDQSFGNGHWFTAQQLMTMKEYPNERLRDLFYAESVSLVEFLAQYRDARRFVDFVRAAERNGYEFELRRVYGFTNFSQLDELWSAHVRTLIASRNRESRLADSSEAEAGPALTRAAQVGGGLPSVTMARSHLSP